MFFVRNEKLFDFLSIRFNLLMKVIVFIAQLLILFIS